MFQKNEFIIKRPECIKRLLSFKDKKIIKIITGVRRSGKSTLLRLYQSELINQGNSIEQIQYINLEDLDHEHLKNYRTLYDQIIKNLLPDKQNYIFIDEIQLVEDFGKAANSLYLKDNIDLYITGSNSKIHSKDIANSIEREYVTIHLLPLSFREFCSAFGDEKPQKTIDDLYNDYLLYSSFPHALNYRMYENQTLQGWDKIAVRSYLNDLYEKIILKDIVENKKISELSRLELVIKFMVDNISKETSINNIANVLTASGRKIDNKTIEKYIDAFCDSFILYKTNRYDLKGKEILKTQNKFYLVDIGLRYLLLGDKKSDSGNILENIVYLELLRRDYKVYIGKIKGKEIDFVAEGPHGIEYIQVAETIRDENTFAREIASLESIDDHCPKIILTRDYDEASYKGIKIFNVLKWILN